MFEVCVFHGLKWCFCELVEDNRKVPLREISGTFWTIPVKTGEKPMKVCIVCNMLGRWAQSVNDCSPVTINGRGAPV